MNHDQKPHKKQSNQPDSSLDTKGKKRPIDPCFEIDSKKAKLNGINILRVGNDSYPTFCYTSKSEVTTSKTITTLIHATHANENETLAQIFKNMISEREGFITLRGTENKHYKGKAKNEEVRFVWFGARQEKIDESKYGFLLFEIDPEFLLDKKFVILGTRKFTYEHSHTMLAVSKSMNVNIDGNAVPEDVNTLKFDSNNNLTWTTPQGLNFEYDKQKAYDHLEVAVQADTVVEIPLNMVTIRFVSHNPYGYRCYHKNMKQIECSGQRLPDRMLSFFKKLMEMTENDKKFQTVLTIVGKRFSKEKGFEDLASLLTVQKEFLEPVIENFLKTYFECWSQMEKENKVYIKG